MTDSTQAAPRAHASSHADESRLSRPAIRTALVLIVDMALAGSAAVTLGAWAGQTSSTWEVIAVTAFVGTLAVFLIVRTVLMGRFSVAGASLLGTGRETLVVYVDVGVLLLLFAVWCVSRQAALGWACLTGSALLLVGSSVQLLLDVVLARNRRGRGLRRRTSQQLARSLEMTRLGAGVVSLLVLSLLGTLAGWDPQSLSQLIVFVAVAIGIATLLRTFFPRRWAVALNMRSGR